MKHYVNGNYEVFIFKDGTKVRMTHDDKFMPNFPESMDICITKKCGIGCPFCYENCTKEGKHSDINKYDRFLRSLRPYTEAALNGNDMDHPQLELLLRKLKNNNVFPNITVNQKQFVTNFEKIKAYVDEGLIYGVGVSFTHYSDELLNYLKLIPNAVLHTIVGITTMDEYHDLKDKGLKVLILGYKRRGRGKDFVADKYESVDYNFNELRENIGQIIKEKWFNVVSFDNLALEQLDIQNSCNIPEDKWGEMYMGDDGQFTFYVDLVEGKFARNSISEERYEMEDMTSEEMFKIIRRETDMNKVQVRRGIFETNSSSTHVISISKDNDEFKEKLPNRVHFGHGDFGWEWEVYNTLQDKANYLFTAIVDNGKSRKYKPLITAILAKHGIEAEFEETVENQYDNGETYEEFKEDKYAYVDHAYCAKDFIEEVCENEELLMAYLFSDTSFVETGNDNEDGPDDLGARVGAVSIAEYYKGN